MKQSTKLGIGVAIGAAVILMAVGVAGAQANDSCTPTTWPDGHQGWGMWECNGWKVFDGAAGALGLTPEELFTELHGGTSLAEIAEAQGVKLETVQQAITAARDDARQAAIQQAVEDGKLTQAQADWLLQGLKLGLGPGARGPQGFRGHPGWQQ